MEETLSINVIVIWSEIEWGGRREKHRRKTHVTKTHEDKVSRL